MLSLYAGITVADLEILIGGFGWYIHSAPPKAVRRAAKRGKSFYVFFLAIRKRSRSISAHSGHVAKKIDQVTPDAKKIG